VEGSGLSINLLNEAARGASISPSSASPVLKSEVTLYLDSTYPEILVREDFTATLYSNDDDTFERVLFVLRVNDAEKSVTVKFPGAYSGSYWI